MSYNKSLLSSESCNTDLIYNQYKDTISELIAYIEVYEHDLPEDVMAEIAELFQMIAFYETDIQNMQESDVRNALYSTSVKVTQSLYIHAICLFINRIQEYQKVFKKFKYKGVMLDNINFINVAKSEEQKIVKSFSAKLKLFYKGKVRATLKCLKLGQQLKYLFGYFKVSVIPSLKVFKHEPYIPKNILVVDNLEEENLEEVYNATKELLQKYEKIFPEVISNGANKTLGMSIFLAGTSWIIPIVLLIPMLIKLFGGK